MFRIRTHNPLSSPSAQTEEAANPRVFPFMSLLGVTSAGVKAKGRHWFSTSTSAGVRMNGPVDVGGALAQVVHAIAPRVDIDPLWQRQRTHQTDLTLSTTQPARVIPILT